MAKNGPEKDDLVLMETPDGGWTVMQGKTHRLAPATGLHLTDWDRAEETALDIGNFEKVDVWVLENGKHRLLKSYRGSLTSA